MKQNRPTCRDMEMIVAAVSSDRPEKKVRLKQQQRNKVAVGRRLDFTFSVLSSHLPKSEALNRTVLNKKLSKNRKSKAKSRKMKL